MKKINYYKNPSKSFFFFILFSVIFNKNIYAKEKISLTVKYKEVGLVWGLLKYYAAPQKSDNNLI
jgi:hypothetical protein